MHLAKFDGVLTPQQKMQICRAFDMVRNKLVLPSMRSLQFGGEAIEKNNLRTFNCATTHVDSIRSIAEFFYLLLCGTGVGIGVSNKYVARIPELVRASDRNGTIVPYTVDDTIEGWANSIEVLLLCYTQGNPFSGRKVVFDYSRIRPKGAPLKVGGGKAPGYVPLKNALLKIKRLLDTVIEKNGQTSLRSIDAYDICMHLADAVVSGGVRRSATIAVFDKDDEEMLMAKTGDWFKDNPQRGRSNNSVLLLRNQVSFEEFKAIVQRTREWGEPGFVFAEHEDTLFNPCAEISFIPVTKDGRTGVQMCNLSSVNGAAISTEEQFMEAVEAAALIGTLQATYTEFPYLRPSSVELTEEEALLGVSITGMMEHHSLLFDPVVQQRAAKVAVDTNIEWAEILGINPAARVTCIKPEGSGSLAVGTMASGIHAAEDHWMFRRVQANKNDPVYRHFKKYNPHMCEESVWSANGTDDVVTFPIRVPDEAMVKRDLDALTHLSMIKSTQENWVMSGTTSANRKPITHNTSCTVLVKDHEWDQVTAYLYQNREFFSAVSLLSDSGGKKYAQAPVEGMVTSEDFEKFHSLLDGMVPVDYTELIEYEDGTDVIQEVACAGGQCSL